MRLKFCSLWTAALCPWVSEPCPPPPGREEGEKRNLDREELALPLPVLTRTRWGAALTHCVAVTYHGQGHWATWSLGREGGRAGFRSLLPSCAGSPVMEAREEVSKAGSGARAGQKQKFFVGTLTFCSAVLTRSLPVLNVYGRDFEKAPRRRFRTWILSGGWGALLASLFFLSFLTLDG